MSNLVTNGNFDLPNITTATNNTSITGWSLSGYGTNRWGLVDFATSGHDKTGLSSSIEQYAYINKDTYLYQFIVFPEAGNYVITFWVYSNNSYTTASPTVLLKAEIGTSGVIVRKTFDSIPNTTWTKYSVSFLIASGALTQALGFTNVSSSETQLRLTGISITDATQTNQIFNTGIQTAGNIYLERRYIPGLFFRVYSGYHDESVTFFDSNTTYYTGGSGSNTGISSNFSSLDTATNYYVSELQNFEPTVSILWVGYFKPDVTGSWTFRVHADDSTFLWIGLYASSGYTVTNRNVLSNGYNNIDSTVTLTAGTYYPIRVQYGNHSGDGFLNLYFKGPAGSSVSAFTMNGTGFYFNNGLNSSGNINGDIIADKITTTELTFSPNQVFRFVPWKDCGFTFNTSNATVASNSFGGAITATITGTTAPTPSQNSTCKYNYSVIGNTMYLQFSYMGGTNAGSAGSGIYTWKLPAGYNIDTSLISVQNPAITTTTSPAKGTVIGNSYIAQWGTTISTSILVYAVNSTQFCAMVFQSQNTGSINAWHSHSSTQFNYGSFLHQTINCSFPIT